MTEKSKKIVEEALTLSDKERTEVVEHLLNSIEHPPALTDDELRAVVARRSAEIGDGKVEPVSWGDVKKRVNDNQK